jgi:hypothetical protein
MENFRKILKILLPIITLILLGLTVYFFYTKEPAKIIEPKAPNTFIKEINLKIEKLNSSSRRAFCVTKYATIKNDIFIYTKEDKIDLTYKNVLLQKLDSTYAKVFIAQAYNVLDGNLWESHKMDSIRTEVRYLLHSRYIPRNNRLIEINAIVTQYDEINIFISNAISVPTSVTRVDQKFNFNASQQNIKIANNYRNLKVYLRHCNRLQAQLQNIPRVLYDKHLSFLTNKVNFCIGRYTLMTYYADYFENIYKPIQADLQFLSDNYSTYSVDFSKAWEDLSILKEKMKKDNNNADQFLKH